MTGLEDLPDGRYTAVIDTVEDGHATVFFEQDGEEIGHAVLDATRFPADARHADAILSVTISGSDLVEMEYQPDRTAERAEQAQGRFDRLSERPPSDEE